MTINQPKAQQFFTQVTAWPKLVLILSILSIVGMASFIPKLQQDTSADAFIDKDNPVLVYRDQVRETFGLEDPMVIAIVNDGGVFTPANLAIVDSLTHKIAALDNIDPERIISLATESNISGTADGIDIEKFFEQTPVSEEKAKQIQTAVNDFPLYQGSIVARDNSATLIVAELLDQDIAANTYNALMAIVNAEELPQDTTLHVAGEGAVAGYLATYISNDAKKLNPLAGVIIFLVMFIAFRTLGSVLIPNLVVAGTVAAALGLMSASGISFFVITNGLTVILIGIAVADSIHIFSQYYEERAKDPDATRRNIIIRAMVKMWRPVTLTTITTIAGFIGLYLGAELPPMKYFGLFAAVGVFAAWVYSMFLIPAAVTLFPIKPSKLFAKASKNASTDIYSKTLQTIGNNALSNPKLIIAIWAVIAVIGIYGTSKVIIQESQIENFQTTEAIYIADKQINQRLDGTYLLDIVVETNEVEGLYDPENLRKIEALQRHVETIEQVNGSTSLVDFVKQMNKGLNENEQSFYAIPDDRDLVAQLFFLFSSTGDPTDLEEEVDYDFQKANVRFNLSQSDYRTLAKIVPEIQVYVDNTFNNDNIKATLSGRVSVNYAWLKTIGDNHIRSLALSLLFVFVAAALVFRSATAGLFAIIPVIASLLVVYAVMGYGNIWLSVGTSMFAAISIGLGIDFAIHTLDRMRELLSTRSGDYDNRLSDLFPTTGRALFFNFVALTLAFSVLFISDVPPLLNFGTLVVTSVTASFLASITILPILGKRIKPKFLIGNTMQPIPTPTQHKNLTLQVSPASPLQRPSQSAQ